MCVFTALSIAYYSRANFTRTVYRNYTYTGVNTYVGGDAYNYIINGTYFTGYSVIGTGFMVSAVACGIGAAVVGLKEQEEKRKIGEDNAMKNFLEGPFDRDDDDDFMDDIELGAVFAALGEIKKEEDEEDDDALFDDEEDDLFDDDDDDGDDWDDRVRL